MILDIWDRHFKHPFWSYQRSSVIVLFFFLLDYRFLKRVSEEMGKMLKEVMQLLLGGGY